VHLYEPHFPYAPPEALRERFRGRPYQGEVAAADRALEPLLRPLLERGKDGRTLVIVTSDHGESLGEHGEATHGIFAYEATLRVPLLLYAPRLFRPRVVRDVARHVDILPTVLDALGMPIPGETRGTSLLEAAQAGAALHGSSYFEALTGAFSRGWAPLYGILDGGQKYIELPEPELYDVTSDPREQQNQLAKSDASRLRGLLAAERARDRGARRGAPSAEVRERLGALGYVAGSGAIGDTPATPEDDPKRLIGLDTLLQRATTAEMEGRTDEAIALVREVLAKRPRMLVAHAQLARLLRASGDLAGAVQALRRALEQQPRDAVSAALLGAYLNEAGRPQDAIALLRAAGRGARAGRRRARRAGHGARGRRPPRGGQAGVRDRAPGGSERRDARREPRHRLHAGRRGRARGGAAAAGGRGAARPVPRLERARRDRGARRPPGAGDRALAHRRSRSTRTRSTPSTTWARCCGSAASARRRASRCCASSRARRAVSTLPTSRVRSDGWRRRPRRADRLSSKHRTAH
jgi:hypothetical protein